MRKPTFIEVILLVVILAMTVDTYLTNREIAATTEAVHQTNQDIIELIGVVHDMQLWVDAAETYMEQQTLADIQRTQTHIMLAKRIVELEDQ